MQDLALTSRFSAALEAVPADLRAGPIGLAVSGGSDSASLLHLAQAWSKTSGARLHVFTVDHQLRPGSAAEAEEVAAVSHRVNLSHQVLHWRDPAPRQSAARRARHALLASALRAVGGRLLLTGHTADDQAETVLMRIRQGSGWYGLAGMRARSLSPVWPEGEGVWIARPLLGETRAGLRHWLTGQGEGWMEDPSNANAAFERVRVRALLQAQPERARTVLACQAGFAQLRRIEDAALARWLTGSVCLGPDGHLVASFEGLPPERAARGLGVLIQCAGQHETPPRSASLADLAARILGSAGFRGATLGRVRLRPTRGGAVAFSPDPGGPHPPADPARLKARIASFQRLFLNSPQELARLTGKESFLQGLTPIFHSEPVSFARDLP